MDSFDNGDPGQTEGEFRRRLAAQIRRNSEDIEALRRDMPGKPPWWTQFVMGALIALLGGYISIVHRIGSANTEKLDQLTAQQDRRAFLVDDVADMKNRLRNAESLTQQLPSLIQQIDRQGLNDIRQSLATLKITVEQLRAEQNIDNNRYADTQLRLTEIYALLVRAEERYKAMQERLFGFTPAPHKE